MLPFVICVILFETSNRNLYHTNNRTSLLTALALDSYILMFESQLCYFSSFLILGNVIVSKFSVVCLLILEIAFHSLC